MMKKIFTVFFALTAVLTLLGACGSQASSGDPEKALTEVRVVLDWYPNAIHTFLYEAEEKGYFEEEGLSVRFISPAESVDAVNFVATGKAEIGLTYPIDILLAHENGMPVKALGAVAQSALDCMCSLRSHTDITADLSTLKGKKIGYAGTAISRVVVDTVTAAAGLAPGDYEPVDVGFDLVTALTTESVDLVVGTFINDEVVTMEQNGYELNVYREQDYGIPELYGLVIAVNGEDTEKRPALYEGFLRACRKGFSDMKANEESALELIMSRMNSDDNPLDEAQQRKSYELLLPIMEPEGKSFLSMEADSFETLITWMQETGQIRAVFPASEVMSEIKP